MTLAELRGDVERLSDFVKQLEGLILTLSSLVLLVVAADPSITSPPVALPGSRG